MPSTWSIKLYESGPQTPVEDFIKSLQASTIAKLTRNLELLGEFGSSLSMPIAKPLGGSLFELRVRGKQEVRLIYVLGPDKTIILLHGFLKKNRSISKRDLRTAVNRQKESHMLGGL